MNVCLCHLVPEGYVCMRCAAERGYPETMGFRSFDQFGNKKGTTQLARCRVINCDRSMVANGFCLGHYRIERAIA